MSVESEKLKCSVCHSFLFDDDDVVYCPECGAPHHRDCYNSLGRCGFEDKHGTAEQYSRAFNTEEEKPEANTGLKKCAMCGTEYGENEFSCPNCKTPDSAHIGRMGITFDYLGGVPSDMDLGDGVKAEEAKQFVFANSQRYIPKFASFKLGKKTSFNLLAFLFPSAWFLSRKMYKNGIFAGILNIALSLLLMPFITAVNTFVPENVKNYAEMAKEIANNSANIGKPIMITALVTAVLILAFKIICGVFGDLFYKNHCIRTISKLKKESEDIEEDFRKKGGVNIFMFLIGLLAVDYIPQIIAVFFM